MQLLAVLALAVLLPPLVLEARIAVCRVQLAALEQKKEVLIKEKKQHAEEMGK